MAAHPGLAAIEEILSHGWLLPIPFPIGSVFLSRDGRRGVGGRASAVGQRACGGPAATGCSRQGGGSSLVTTAWAEP